MAKMADSSSAVFACVIARGTVYEPGAGCCAAEDAQGRLAERTPATASSHRQRDELVLPRALLRLSGAGDRRGGRLRPVPPVAGLVGVVERAGLRRRRAVHRRGAAPAVGPGAR